jgi:quinohemoprotein ethanol dehydrogenase
MTGILGVALAGIVSTVVAGGRPGWVTDARLEAVDAEPGNWLTTGRDYGDNRFSPLHAIDDGNVARLRLAWYHDLDTHRGQEATPIAVDGVLYTTSAWSKVQAFRAATGELVWQYDPKVPGTVGARACCDVVNRGVAVWQGRVYVGTLDGRLVALDAGTGKRIWSVLTVDPKRPYTISGAPLVVAGKVVIGNGGAEFGVRGYVTAYDARTGRKAWRFYTVPGDPAKGFESEALRRAVKTWSGKWWQDGGGGTVWNSLSYDPELGLVYFGTGNASPWTGPAEGGGRGDGLYAASIVAVHAADGTYAWHYQTTPGDSWDYDSAQTLTLATLKMDGRDRKVVMQAAKNGFFYVLDRASGELVSAKGFVPLNWAKGVDLRTGRPLVDPEAHYEASGKMWIAAPGPYGGHNWQPMSFSPLTGLVYIPAQELPFAYLKIKDFRPEAVGGNMGIDLATAQLPPDSKTKAAILASLKGFLLAWDPIAGREVWRAEHAGPWNGGVLSTAGNLVFQGTASGEFAAWRASDGAKLWSFPVQTGIIAAPMTFTVDGRQFVTVLAGSGGAFPLAAGEAALKSGRLPNRSRVLTFVLDGAAELPPAAVVAAELPAPPTTTAAPALIAPGARDYTRYCSACHGPGAYSGGVLPDLRYSRALADDALWRAAVHTGALSANGMIAFEPALGAERLAAVRAYLIAQAQQSYAAERNKAGAPP